MSASAEGINGDNGVLMPNHVNSNKSGGGSLGSLALNPNNGSKAALNGASAAAVSASLSSSAGRLGKFSDPSGLNNINSNNSNAAGSRKSSLVPGIQAAAAGSDGGAAPNLAAGGGVGQAPGDAGPSGTSNSSSDVKMVHGKTSPGPGSLALSSSGGFDSHPALNISGGVGVRKGKGAQSNMSLNLNVMSTSLVSGETAPLGGGAGVSVPDSPPKKSPNTVNGKGNLLKGLQLRSLTVFAVIIANIDSSILLAGDEEDEDRFPDLIDLTTIFGSRARSTCKLVTYKMAFYRYTNNKNNNYRYWEATDLVGTVL
jgi:hypothetical protein